MVIAPVRMLGRSSKRKALPRFADGIAGFCATVLCVILYAVQRGCTVSVASLVGGIRGFLST